MTLEMRVVGKVEQARVARKLTGIRFGQDHPKSAGVPTEIWHAWLWMMAMDAMLIETGTLRYSEPALDAEFRLRKLMKATGNHYTRFTRGGFTFWIEAANRFEPIRWREN